MYSNKLEYKEAKAPYIDACEIVCENIKKYRTPAGRACLRVFKIQNSNFVNIDKIYFQTWQTHFYSGQVSVQFPLHEQQYVEQLYFCEVFRSLITCSDRLFYRP